MGGVGSDYEHAKKKRSQSKNPKKKALKNDESTPMAQQTNRKIAKKEGANGRT